MTANPVTKNDIGRIVLIWRNGWHAAKLAEVGLVFCRVVHPVKGRIKVHIEDVKLYEV